MRITGGIHRSRKLRAPRGAATRPTSDRVREALFGALSAAGTLEGARVLDLYAGTGALALEALSRGAAGATLVETSREALAAIHANVAALGYRDHVNVLAADVERAASRLAQSGPYDLVLADPPWDLVDTGDAPRALEGLIEGGALVEGGTLVLEHAARTPAPTLNGLELVRTKRYGDTALGFYKLAILDASPHERAMATPG